MPDKITMNYGSDDLTVSLSSVTIAPATIVPANGAEVENYFSAKDNSAYLLLTITTAGEMTIKAGDAYPINNCLGDMVVELPVGTHVISIERNARFENKGGSLKLAFAESTVGTIAAFGKKAGLR